MKRISLLLSMVLLFVFPVTAKAENVQGWFQEVYAMGKKISVGDKIPFFTDTEDYDTMYGELIEVLPEKRKIYGAVYRKGLFRLCEKEETETKSPGIDHKGFCKLKWPDDYVMQRHCFERQQAAFWDYVKIDRRYPGDTEETQIIRRCIQKWTSKNDHVDWVMAVHCMQRQINAYKYLNK